MRMKKKKIKFYKLPKPTSGLVVDGSTVSGGMSEYQILDLSTNKILLTYKIGIATNNLAEIYALVNGVVKAIQTGQTKVYSDSQTAIAWLKHKHINTDFDYSKNEKATILSNRCNEVFDSLTIQKMGTNKLKINNCVDVLKWETKMWGENPADFGRKY